ncbi:MAG: sulfite exporter TauE/SafE family protein [Thermoanaerobaculia bacterium]
MSLRDSAIQAPFLVTLGLGFLLGLRHALDADHLVAVSTIVGRHKSLWRSSVIGAYWGLGHTVSLLLASVVVIGLRRTIPQRAAQGLEVLAGLMLVVLGLDLLRRAAKGELSVHTHEHDGHVHLHAHTGRVPEKAHHHIGKRPFIVGMVHGLAGSAALTIVVLSTIQSPWAGLFYVLVFGLGTIVGMLVMSAAVGLPFALAARKASRLAGRVQVLAALSSIGFGLWYAYRILFVEGLLKTL